MKCCNDRLGMPGTCLVSGAADLHVTVADPGDSDIFAVGLVIVIYADQVARV